MMARRGFTLIELLIVVLVIGVLAAIAIPKFAGVKDRAHVAAMKSDLRNLITAQEAYASSRGSYATNTTATDLSFRSSAGVTVTIVAADTLGWAATASHNASAKTCGIHVGAASPPFSGAQAGQVVCN
jgi:prepilin-type N-terminal cleavage/methylation domain-containing protein